MSWKCWWTNITGCRGRSAPDRRAARPILELSAATGLDVDCGVSRDDEPQAALAKLDNHLCELKELQIRDGLHVFGVAPEGGC